MAEKKKEGSPSPKMQMFTTKSIATNRTWMMIINFFIIMFFLYCIVYVPIPLVAKEILIFGGGYIFKSLTDMNSFFFPSQTDKDD